MNRKIAWKALAVTGVAALALTGCGSGNTAPKVEKSSSDLVGWKSVPTSALQQGGTLNLAATEGDPTTNGNWNPNTSLGANAGSTDVEAPTTGTLIKATADGGWVADPNYATSVKLVSTSPQVVDVKLNPKAVWQDGSPLTATDYQATFAALSGKNTKYDIASSAGFNDISKFDVVSPTEFKITFAKTYADWPAVLQLSAVPASIAKNVQAWNKGYVSKPLPSNGPFMVSKLDNTAKIVTMVPNPRWWGPKPKLSEITWTDEDATTATQAFVNNELNAVEVDQDVDSYRTAKAKPKSLVERSGGLTYSQVTFNGTKTPLNDVKVREAIGHALDQKLVAKTANAPVGYPDTTQGSYIFMPGQKGYHDTVGQVLGYSAAKAKALLKSDGYTFSGKEWMKNGQPLKLTLTYLNDVPTQVTRAELIQHDLAAIGISVKLVNVTDNAYFSDIVAGDFEMVTFSWQGTLFPISSTESLFYPAGKPGGNGQNYSFVTDPSLGTLWSQANNQLDPAKRLVIANKIDKVIAKLAPMVPFAPSPQIFVVNKNLANYGPAQFESIDWTKVGFKKGS